MNPGSGLSDTSNTGNTLRPYLRRKKSSFGETKVAVIGTDGVGKSGKCSSVLVFQWSSVPMFQCSGDLMLKIPVFLCSSVLMFPCFSFPLFQCSSVPMFQCSGDLMLKIPVFLCSSVLVILC